MEERLGAPEKVCEVVAANEGLECVISGPGPEGLITDGREIGAVEEDVRCSVFHRA